MLFPRRAHVVPVAEQTLWAWAGAAMAISELAAAKAGMVRRVRSAVVIK